MRKKLMGALGVALVAFFVAPAFAQETTTSRRDRKANQTAQLMDSAVESQGSEGFSKLVGTLSEKLGLSSETLQAQAESSQLSPGNFFIAESLADALNKKDASLTQQQAFDQIMSLRQDGQGWGQIANSLDLKLGKIVSSLRKNANALAHGGQGQQAGSEQRGRSGEMSGRGAEQGGASSSHGVGLGRGSGPAGGAGLGRGRGRH